MSSANSDGSIRVFFGNSVFTVPTRTYVDLAIILIYSRSQYVSLY
jgi:hypothetical protein